MVSIGCRINSEILKLQWREVDFEAGEVRLDAGATKHGDGRGLSGPHPARLSMNRSSNLVRAEFLSESRSDDGTNNASCSLVK